MKKIIFSGIQPTGLIHIGNYFGAIRQWIELSEKKDYQCIYAIVNLHAITEPIKSRELVKNTYELAASLLALGLDPNKVIFFLQSDIVWHTYLAWILNVVTPLGDLKRMTQFKDKAAQFKDSVNAGLLNYPILMAADILLYNANLVPVGFDQLQHLELTREIARRFNSRFGRVFVLPQPYLRKEGAKIYSLVEPTKKMSKSKGFYHYLGVFESPSVIREKIAKAVTDSGREIKYDPKNKPGISNLLVIYSLLTSKSISEIEQAFQNKGYADFKKDLAERFIDYFKLARKEYLNLKKDKRKIRRILLSGAKKAEEIARERYYTIAKKVGLIID